MYDSATLKPLIVAKIAAGEFVEDFAGADGYPAKSTISDWLMADESFRQQCARAREASAGAFEARVAAISDRVERGELDPKAGAVAINALTWICKVRNRKVYGDKVEVDARLDVGGAILERLARARGRVIEHDRGEGVLLPESDSDSTSHREAA